AADALAAEAVPFRLQEAGSLFSFFLGCDSPVRDFGEARAQSAAAYAAFFHGMLDGGVYLPPSPFEAWFLTASRIRCAACSPPTSTARRAGRDHFPARWVMQPIRKAERLVRAFEDTSSAVRGLPLPNQDKVWNRVRSVGPDELLQFDRTL